MGRTNKNYQTEAQDFEFGQYFNNFKWNYIYENIWIYEGYYNEQGQKNGKQFELNDVVWEYLQMYFFFRSLVIYNGEQNNWKQVGKWDILKFLQNGCKLYDDQKLLSVTGSKKIGRQVELIHDYGSDSQLSYFREYRNSKIFGRWDIFFY